MRPTPTLRPRPRPLGRRPRSTSRRSSGPACSPPSRSSSACCPGPYALLAWLVAGVLILCDSMIWGELGAALPAAGGSYHFLLESYGRSTLGPADGLPVRLADPHQRAARSRVRARRRGPVLDRHRPGVKAVRRASTRGARVGVRNRRRPDDKVGVAIGPTRLFGFAARRGDPRLALPAGDDARAAERRLPRSAYSAVLGVGAVRGGDALRSGPGVRYVARPTANGRALRAGASAPGWRSRSTRTSATTTCATSAARSATRPATIPRSILLSALVVVVLFTLVHLAIIGVVPWQEAAPGEGQPDGRVHDADPRPVGGVAGHRAASSGVASRRLLRGARLFAGAVRRRPRGALLPLVRRRPPAATTSPTGRCC